MIPPEALAGKAQLAAVQIGRLVGMIMVIAYHALIASKANGPTIPPWMESIVGYFSVSVEFFFVATGFILYYAMGSAGPRPGWLRKFARQRLSRAYIAYLPVGMALALIYLLLPQIRGGDHFWTWFSTVTLLPSAGMPSLIPAWTLQHDLVFFILFGLLMATRRLFAGMALWAAAILAFGDVSGPGRNVLLSPINLDFIFGIVAAWWVLHGPKGYAVPAAAIGLGIIGFWLAGSPQFTPFAGIGSAGLLAGMVQYERQRPLRLPAAAILLADASFCVYLVNNPLLSVTYRLSDFAALDWPGALIFGTGTCLLAGTLYHLAWERPALAHFRRSGRGAAARLAPPPASTGPSSAPARSG